MNILWKEKQPAGNLDKKWYCCSSDSDGSHFIAGVYTGRLYISDDIGETWSEVQPLGDTDQEWISCSSDWNGSHLLAGTDDGRVFVSTDYGINWTEKEPGGASSELFYCCASNGDGTRLVAAEKDGRAYMSEDSGVTWNEIQPVGDRDMLWKSVLMSESGKNIVFNTRFPEFQNDPCYYLSFDYGITWDKSPTYPGNINMWTVRDEDGNKVYRDSDGARLGRLTLYSYLENKITETLPAGDINKNWKDMHAGADGVTHIAIVLDGRLYIGLDVSATNIWKNNTMMKTKNDKITLTNIRQNNTMMKTKNDEITLKTKIDKTILLTNNNNNTLL